MNLPALKRFGLRLTLLLLASYGTLYFSYKWYPSDVDFRATYAQMDKEPLDLLASDASHGLRQGSAIVTYLLYKSGANYPSSVAFSDPRIDQRLYFAALLANYLGVALAAALVGSIAALAGGDSVLSLLAGLLCLLSFHTQSFVLTGGTEGVTWALVSLIFLLMLQDSRWLLAGALLLSIFQRELIVVAFALISAFSLLMRSSNPKNARFVLVTSLLCFALYVVIRKIAYPIDLSGQLSFSHLLANARVIHLSATLFFQGLVSQNVMIMCAVLAAILRLEDKPPVKTIPVLLATYAMLVLIALFEGEMAGDVGNVSGILTPLFAGAAAIGVANLQGRRAHQGDVAAEANPSPKA